MVFSLREDLGRHCGGCYDGRSRLPEHLLASYGSYGGGGGVVVVPVGEGGSGQSTISISVTCSKIYVGLPH